MNSTPVAALAEQPVAEALIKIMSCVESPTAGKITFEGRPVALASPRDAFAPGIATVHQDVGSVPLMSIARNFFLGNEPTKGRGPFTRIDFDTANRIAIERIQAMGIRRSPIPSSSSARCPVASPRRSPSLAPSISVPGC